MAMTDIEAIIFDLDDTLVNTYEILVTPLEMEAARRMKQIKPGLPAVEELAALILEIRKKNPRSLEEEIRKSVPQLDNEVLAVRQEVFRNADPGRLFLEPEVECLLRDLDDRYELYLLTQGDTDFQNRKIDHLGIRRFFREVVITEPGCSQGKGGGIRYLLAWHRFRPGSVAVVGNRLDIEIQEACRLGLHTVWLKNGEGCCLCPDEGFLDPHHTIQHVCHLRSVFLRS